MAKIKKMITNNSIVLIIKDKKYVVNRFDDVKGGVPVVNSTAEKVLAILKESVTNPDLLDADTSPILSLIDINVSLKNSPFYIDKVQCKVYVEGEEVNEYVSKKIIQANEAGKYFQHIVNFWKRLKQNPIESARNELFLFLEHNGLPLTKEGYFIAYKTVRSDYYSSYNYKVGNPDNVLNLPGTWVTFKREDVDARRNVTCSNGLHAANYHYAVKEYGSDKALTLIIDPADVVTIPSDYKNQKMRTCAYYVLEDCKGEFKENFIDEDYNLPAKPTVYGVKTPEIEEIKEVVEEAVKAEPWVATPAPVQAPVATPTPLEDIVNNPDNINYYESYTNAIGVLWEYHDVLDGHIQYRHVVKASETITKVKIGEKVFATWKPASTTIMLTFVKPEVVKNKPGILKKAVDSLSSAISSFIGDKKPARGPDGKFISNKPSTAFGKAVSKFVGNSNLPKRGPDGKFLKKGS